MKNSKMILRALVVITFLTFAASVGAQGPLPKQPAKIAPELGQALEVLQAGERLPVIVTLRTQADLRHLDGRDRAERLERVVATLQETANATQGPIRALLHDQRLARETGAVSFFWIFNGLSVTASAQAIAALAAHPEVRTIALEGTIPAPPELARSPAGTAASASEWNITLINAPALWQLGFQGEGIVVANMDTGACRPPTPILPPSGAAARIAGSIRTASTRRPRRISTVMGPPRWASWSAGMQGVPISALRRSPSGSR